MPRDKNPFAQQVPVTDQDVDPFAVLRVASSAPTTVTPAKEISDAVSDAVGPADEKSDPNEQTIGGRPQFKKGPLKGMDKQVFFAMLADTLHGLGGGSQGSKFTRMAMEQKAEQDRLAARKQEIEEDREFREEQAAADREARASEVASGIDQKKFDRDHEARLAKMRIDAQAEQQARNHQLETEVLQLRAKFGVRADAANEVFDGISDLPGLKLPAHINAEAAMENPEILEEARRLIAPHKERMIFARIEAQRNSKEAQRQAELSAAAAHGMDLWMQGLSPVSEAEQQATGNFSPTKQILVPDPQGQGGAIQRGSAKEMAIQDTEAIGADVLSDPDLRAQRRQEFVDEAFLEYLSLQGGAFRSLDGELQKQVEQSMRGHLALLWDREATATINNQRAIAAGQPILDQPRSRSARSVGRLPIDPASGSAFGGTKF